MMFFTFKKIKIQPDNRMYCLILMISTGFFIYSQI